jgi:hypothetical protein
MFANILSKISTQHASYKNVFYNPIINNPRLFIGAGCGIGFYLEYYDNKTIDYDNRKINPIVDQNKKKIMVRRQSYFGITYDDIESDKEFEARQEIVRLIKLKNSNPFSKVINHKAPISLNIFTTTFTGGVLGYIYALYWPVAIPLTIGYNLATIKKSDLESRTKESD